MPTLRKLLASAFGTVALIATFISVGTTFPLLLHPFHFHSVFLRSELTPWLRVWRLVLTGLVMLLLLSPPVLTGLYGMAWWTVRRAKPSARKWAIAASTAILVHSLPLLVVLVYIARYYPIVHGGWWDLAILPALTLTLGILGLVAFLPRDSAAQPEAAVPAPPRIAGDGTSTALDMAATALAFAGYFAGIYLWERWAAAHHIQFELGILATCLALFLTTVFHELGHALTGLALGMKLQGFHAGPLEARNNGSRWQFKFTPAAFAGSVTLVPRAARPSRWSDIGAIAAGPLASLLVGAVAFQLAITARGRSYENALGFLAILATLNFIAFFVNLLPLRPDGLYSDGANIYQRLKGGPWADFRLAIAAVLSTTVTPLRPRDFEIERIQRASAAFTHGRQAVLLRLMASSYHLDRYLLDRGELSAAIAAIADAEAAYDSAPWPITPGLCLTFAFRIALLQRDAERARIWWDRAEAQHPEKKVEYWMANSALLFLEDHAAEARAAWEQASALAAQLPAAGDCDFDRDCCALLGQAQTEATVAR